MKLVVAPRAAGAAEPKEGPAERQKAKDEEELANRAVEPEPRRQHGDTTDEGYQTEGEARLHQHAVTPWRSQRGLSGERRWNGARGRGSSHVRVEVAPRVSVVTALPARTVTGASGSYRRKRGHRTADPILGCSPKTAIAGAIGIYCTV